MTREETAIVEARFISAKTEVGRKIRRGDGLHARYRSWLGKKIQVDLDTAEFLNGNCRTLRVEITLPWGESKCVLTSMIEGLTFQQRNFMQTVAMNKRAPNNYATNAAPVTVSAPAL